MQDKLSRIIEAVRSSPQYARALAAYDKGNRVMISGLPPVMQAVLAKCLWLEKGGPLLLLAATPEEAQVLYENIAASGGGQTELFAPLELLPFEVYAQNAQVTAGRLRVLSRLALGEPLLVVSSVSAFWRRLPPPQVFASFHLTLRRGVSYGLSDLPASLYAMGYRREKQVEEPGVFSLRGGILDIFSPQMENPLRLDFFGDLLESVRAFDAETQRSGEALPEA
ncbi:MAG: hypothetical protein FWE85_05365, partial [Clostridiales bacterium]|nr:hypothetical protein [Clostridiales bacterium]